MKWIRVGPIVLAVLLMLSTAGCGSTGPRVEYDPNRLSRHDMEAVDVSTLYEVIQRLRPRWLDVRSSRSFETETRIFVFQDQTLLGGIEVLRQLTADMAAEIEYLDGPTASNTLPGLGSTHVEGAIIIRPSTSM